MGCSERCFGRGLVLCPFRGRRGHSWAFDLARCLKRCSGYSSGLVLVPRSRMRANLDERAAGAQAAAAIHYARSFTRSGYGTASVIRSGEVDQIGFEPSGQRFASYAATTFETQSSSSSCEAHVGDWRSAARLINSKNIASASCQGKSLIKILLRLRRNMPSSGKNISNLTIVRQAQCQFNGQRLRYARAST